jgi:hypothetical protein
MLIYLASRYSRFPEMLQVRADLECAGHSVTSRWINGSHQVDDAGLSVEAKKSERLRFAAEDLQDLHRAEAIIAFTEAPRSKRSRGGRHVEFGIALAARKRLIVLGPPENIFYCLPQVEWYPDYRSFRSDFLAQDKREVMTTIDAFAFLGAAINKKGRIPPNAWRDVEDAYKYLIRKVIPPSKKARGNPR